MVSGRFHFFAVEQANGSGGLTGWVDGQVGREDLVGGLVRSDVEASKAILENECNINSFSARLDDINCEIDRREGDRPCILLAWGWTQGYTGVGYEQTLDPRTIQAAMFATAVLYLLWAACIHIGDIHIRRYMGLVSALYVDHTYV